MKGQGIKDLIAAKHGNPQHLIPGVESGDSKHVEHCEWKGPEVKRVILFQLQHEHARDYVVEDDDEDAYPPKIAKRHQKNTEMVVKNTKTALNGPKNHSSYFTCNT